MKNMFTTPDIQLDLSHVQLSIQEENSFFKDGFFTKFTFPFSIDITPKMRAFLGDHSHINASEIPTTFEGWFNFEGNMHKANLQILSVQENTMQVQIDYGFDELPEMNLNISEIPFPEYASIGQANNQHYRFPTLHYDRFLNADFFDGFSHRINARNQNGTFLENDYSFSGYDLDTAIAQAKVRNKNYIQPMPYLIYVLEQAAKNLGYTLAGDILEDNLLKNQLIYKPMKPYTYNDQQEYDFEVDRSDGAPEIQTFEMELNPGEYRLNDNKFSTILRAVVIKHVETNEGLSFYTQTGHGFLRFLVNKQHKNKKYALIVEKSKIDFSHISIKPSKNDYTSDTYNMPSYPLISKIDAWDIRSLLPEITLGDLFNSLKTIFSYYVEIKENKLYINKMRNDTSQAKDMRHCEVKFPNIVYPQRETMTYIFPQIKGYELPAIVVNQHGITTKHIAKKENSSQENETELKFYTLPYITPTMQKSIGEDETVLILVKDTNTSYTPSQYDSRYPKGFHSGDLAEYMKNHNFKLMNNKQIEWSVIDKRASWKQVKISDVLFVYNQCLLIKSITKTILNDEFCHIDIVGVVL